MSKLKFTFYLFSFIITSTCLGIGFAYYVGSNLPERISLTQSKSYEAQKDLIWMALLDIENYPLWKPNLKSVEMLGTNDLGFTKWIEHYGLGKSISYEISEYIPKSLIEIKITSSKKAAKGVWIYKLSDYQDRGVLQIKRFAIVSSKIDRFNRRWIDTKYNEVDFQLMSLNNYLNQLLDDQDELKEIMMPDSVENNEVIRTES